MSVPAIIHAARMPQTYENARAALAECQGIDECKDWADKAAALASYARQAEDDQLERMAQRIRARAIRRAGELLKQIERPETGGRPQNGMADRTVSSAARDAGMSKHQQVQATRIAAIPEPEFERQVESKAAPLTPQQECEIGEVLAELSRGQITRAESNERIAEIDPDWSIRDRVPTLSALAQQGIKPRQPVDLGGRDPKAFNRAMHFTGLVTRYAQDLAGWDASAVIPHLDDGQRAKLRNALRQIDGIHDQIATRI